MSALRADPIMPELTTATGSPDPRAFLTLARDKSAGGRMRLVERLADTYLQPDRSLSDSEAVQLDAFVDELFRGTVPLDVRRHLAIRAARAQTVPPRLARKLACDTIEVAGAFIGDCDGIEDRDLLEVIGLKRLPHRVAVAGRAAVSEAVADALVLTGDVAVIEVLLKNFGARLSRLSINRCIALAKQLQALRLPLVSRPEFTATDASQLLWWLPLDLRRIVADRFGPIAAQGAELGAEPELGSAAAPVSFASDPDDEQVDPIPPGIESRLQEWVLNPPQGAAALQAAHWLAERGAINGTLLTRVLRLRLNKLFVAMLAQHAGLPPVLTERVCADKKGQTFTAICRGINIDKAQFASLYMLAYSAFQGGRTLDPAALGQILTAYERIGPRAANILQAWRENPELLRARV